MENLINNEEISWPKSLGGPEPGQGSGLAWFTIGLFPSAFLFCFQSLYLIFHSVSRTQVRIHTPQRRVGRHSVLSKIVLKFILIRLFLSYVCPGTNDCRHAHRLSLTPKQGVASDSRITWALCAGWTLGREEWDMRWSYSNGQKSYCWLNIHPGDSQASLWLKAAETRYKISLWWLICYTWIKVREPGGVVERAGLQSNEEKVYLTRRLLSSTNSLFQVEAWGFPLDKSSFSCNCFDSLSNFAST